MRGRAPYSLTQHYVILKTKTSITRFHQNVTYMVLPCDIRSDVAIEDTLKVQAIFRFFFVYLTSRASDTLKVQTDYLTFGNLITTSDTPKVQSSEAIAVEEYLLKLYAAIIIVFFSFKQDTSPEY